MTQPAEQKNKKIFVILNPILKSATRPYAVGSQSAAKIAVNSSDGVLAACLMLN